MAKKLISFLGTGNYSPTQYSYNDQVSSENRFVQIAITELLCQDWDSEDELIFLVTSESYEKNWQGPDGLEASLQKISSNAKYDYHLIPNPNNDENIWKIFRTITDLVEDNDEVIFDVTHGFRSFPILVVNILDYLRTVKNINLASIFYGSFDPTKSNEIAPLVELSFINQINDWNQAVSSYLYSGNPEQIAQLSKQEKTLSMKDNSEPNQFSIQVYKVGQSLNKFYQSLMTCRSKELPRTYRAALKALEDFKNILTDEDQHFIIELIQTVEDSLKKYQHDESDELDIFKVVLEFLLPHKYYQQAVTLFLEHYISVLIEILDLGTDEDTRDEISHSLSGVKEGLYTDTLKSLFGDNDKKVRENFNDLRNWRNDINHAGNRDSPIKYNTIVLKIEDILNDLFSIINEFDVVPESVNVENLVLFISHDLTEQQIEDAKNNYNIENFIQLPEELQSLWSQVDPTLSSDDLPIEPLTEWVEENYPSSKAILLVQGELGMVYKLVEWAKLKDYTAIYSTTQRVTDESVDDDGKVIKRSEFKHIRYREF